MAIGYALPRTSSVLISVFKKHAHYPTYVSQTYRESSNLGNISIFTFDYFNLHIPVLQVWLKIINTHLTSTFSKDMSSRSCMK